MTYTAARDIDYDGETISAGEPIPDDWPSERVLALQDIGAVEPAGSDVLEAEVPIGDLPSEQFSSRRPEVPQEPTEDA